MLDVPAALLMLGSVLAWMIARAAYLAGRRSGYRAARGWRS